MADQFEFSNHTTDMKKLEFSLLNLSEIFRKRQDFIKKKYKISALEMDMIQYVIDHGPQKMKDVSKHFHIKLSTLTSIIDKAEQNRVLKRVNSKDDRRVVYLDVTARGRKVYEEYTVYLGEISNYIKSNLDEKVFHNFVESMETYTKLSLQ